MSHRVTVSDRHASRGRKALGLFAAVWLNLALAPCAMAYEAPGEHDCPDCPPVEMQGHHGMHEGMAVEMPCADDLNDCMIDEDVNHDVRGGKLELKDSTPVILYASADADCGDAAPQRRIPVPRYSMVHPGAPPPLHLLNCAFLD